MRQMNTNINAFKKWCCACVKMKCSIYIELIMVIYTWTQILPWPYTRRELCSPVTLVGESSWHISTFMTDWTYTVRLLISRVEELHYKQTLHQHAHTHNKSKKRGSDGVGQEEELKDCREELEKKAKASSSSLKGAGCSASIMHSALFLSHKNTHPSENTALSAYFRTEPDLRDSV